MPNQNEIKQQIKKYEELIKLQQKLLVSTMNSKLLNEEQETEALLQITEKIEGYNVEIKKLKKSLKKKDYCKEESEFYHILRKYDLTSNKPLEIGDCFLKNTNDIPMIFKITAETKTQFKCQRIKTWENYKTESLAHSIVKVKWTDDLEDGIFRWRKTTLNNKNGGNEDYISPECLEEIKKYIFKFRTYTDYG
jgi:hypothetical protein